MKREMGTRNRNEELEWKRGTENEKRKQRIGQEWETGRMETWNGRWE